MWIYYTSIVLLLPAIILAVWAQIKVNSTFKKYQKIPSKSNVVANEASQMLLEKADCRGVRIAHIGGHLTDNYNPQTKVLSLSSSVYNSNSIASLAVCAHEVGHAVQDDQNYAPLKLRSALVKVVNLGSALSLPIALLGIVLIVIAQIFVLNSVIAVAEFIMFLGICCYSLTTVFALVTLPVEINASNRAKKLLLKTGILDKKELKGADKVLDAEALTYVASLVVSLAYLLRFILFVNQFRRN